MKSNRIYITGHQRPDSDSIISAIAYAHFKQRQGIDAIACRLGELQVETKYLLKRFGFEEPMLLDDARAKLEDINMDKAYAVHDESVFEALEMMRKNQVKSLGVLNNKNQLIGIITKSDFAKIGLGDTAFGITLMKDTPIENMVKSIDGRLIYQAENNHFDGRISIIALNKNGIEAYDVDNRLVIIGDTKEGQIKAIEKGAAILVLVWSEQIDKEVLELAKQYQCSIILSGHGCMNTSRYLYFSPRAKDLMKNNLEYFYGDDFVEDAAKAMSKTRYRLYPVVDNDSHLLGFVSRYHLLNHQKKKLILVDHNEYAQSVKGIEQADLLEVIDHHRIGDIYTSQPISFRNEIIGSTSSIITSIFLENQMEISPNLAGLLLGAIISDTLNFHSPTTSLKDKGLASMLSNIAGLDIESFANEMFKVSSSIAGKGMRELIEQDIKAYEIDGVKMMVGQVIVSKVSEISSIEDDLMQELEKYVIDKQLDLVVLAFSSIIDNGSIFYSAGEKQAYVIEAFPNHNGKHSFQENILSRKNQIIPQLSKAIIQL